MTKRTVNGKLTEHTIPVDQHAEAEGSELPSTLLQHLHEVASEQLQRGRYERAIASLARLALALPVGHDATPVVFATLAFAYRACGRLERVRDAEGRIRELCVDVADRTRLLRAARSGSSREAPSFAGRRPCH